MRDGRLVEGMAARGASHVELRFRSFTFTFPNGKLDLVEMDPHISVGHALAAVDGKPMEVYSNAQILCGKLEGRGNRLPERDIFDLAVAEELDVAALTAAVNHLDEDYRREVVHRLRAQAAQYPMTAATVLDPSNARWQPLLTNAPAKAASAMEAVAYASVAVAYGERGIMLRLGSASGSAGTISFGTGNEFAEAIPRLGLAPCFLNVLGTLEAVASHADEQLQAWRHGSQRAPRLDPPYRSTPSRWQGLEEGRPG